MPSILQGGLDHLGSSSFWVPSSPSLFQSVWMSLSDKALWPMTTGTVWGTPGTEHKCQGQKGEGALTWPADPQHSAGCQDRAVCPNHACAPLPSPHPDASFGRAGTSRPALQTCVENKVRSRWEHWLLPWGHGRDRRTGMENLLGLAARPCSSWHPFQNLLSSSGVSRVLKNTCKSR